PLRPVSLLPLFPVLQSPALRLPFPLPLYAPILRRLEILFCEGGVKPPHSKLALLALDLLLGRHCTAPRTLAGASVGVRALAANRQVAAMADAPVRLNFNQAPNVHLNLLAEIAFDAAFLLDDLANVVDFIFCQVANLFRRVDIGLRRDGASANLADPIDRGQP